MTEWDEGYDSGFDTGALEGEARVREELTKRIEDIDLLREQFRTGVPYKVVYRSTGDTQLLDRDGGYVAQFQFESDARAIADILNVACVKDAAVEQVLEKRRAEKARVS